MQDPSTTIALGGLTATLVACLVYVLKYVISRLVPEMQAAHAQQLDRLCTTFREEGHENRNLTLRLHEDNGKRMEALTRAIDENQQGIIELLQRTPRDNGHAPLRLYQPPLPAPTVLGVEGPDDAA